MGATKTEVFTEEQNKLALLFKALAHPASICGDLVGELGLAQATISHHLKELKSAGIIQGTIDGASVCYCINPAAWKLMENHFSNFVTSYKPAANCC